MQKLNMTTQSTFQKNNDKPYELKKDEYLKNGIVYCGSCNTPRSLIFEGKNYYNLQCECMVKKQLEEETNKEEKLLRKEIKELLENSLLGKRYSNCTFENTKIVNQSFEHAYNRCKSYCDNYKKVKDLGLGIYLYGTSGIGKTHLTACMINELSTKLQKCLLTNFFEISREIRNCFKENKSESEYITKICEIDFLFIDDLGTEMVKKNGEDNFLQEKIFEILNRRYNNLKPTIFSSNHNLNELVQERGFMVKTVDRIREMSSAIIKIEGTSFRANIEKTNINF